MTKEELKNLIVAKGTLLSDAMAKLDANAKGILFVVDEQECICGAVSDGDIRRWLLKTGQLNAEIVHLMNKNPKTLFKNQVDDARKYFQEYQVRVLPVIDAGHCIVDVISDKDFDSIVAVKHGGLESVSVIIMAGGKGTRLYPYTKVLPKPLIPIGDIPIVERIIDRYHQFGVTDFFMTVNYRKNMIKSYFSELETDYQIEFVEEEKPLGTAGSLNLIQRKFAGPVFVANCDVLIQADYADMYAYHKSSGNAITIVTAMKNDVIPYGVIYTKEDGVIDKMVEKPTHSYLVNTGMYIINADMIGLIPEGTFFHMTHMTDKAMELGMKVGMYPVSEDSFLDMGQLEEMKRMEEKLHI